jgi:hypothetical protein
MPWSASSEFRLTICPTIAVVSIGAVGSWSWSSVSRRVIKVLSTPPVLEVDVVGDVVGVDCADALIVGVAA